MALQRFNDDLNIIAKLGDNPRTDDGLSTQGFKAKFDEAALKAQQFINNVLIPGIESTVSEDGLLAQIAAALSKKLDLAGGTMTGAINMNGKRLYNLKTPTDDMDAAPKTYVDSQRTAAETTAKNYTDAKHFKKTATISTTWTGETAPYTQEVVVEGVLAADYPHVWPVYSDTLATALLEQEAWLMIGKGVPGAGKITFTCFEELPTVAIPVQIEVNR